MSDNNGFPAQVNANDEADNLIDLADLDTTKACNKPFELELKHPTTGKGLGMYISILGSDSDIFQSIVRDRADRRVREQVEAAERGEKVEPRTSEIADQEACELYAACTTGWRSAAGPVLKVGGELVPFSVGMAEQLYRTLWIRRQIDRAIGKIENFMKA